MYIVFLLKKEKKQGHNDDYIQELVSWPGNRSDGIYKNHSLSSCGFIFAALGLSCA